MSIEINMLNLKKSVFIQCFIENMICILKKLSYKLSVIVIYRPLGGAGADAAAGCLQGAAAGADQ